MNQKGERDQKGTLVTSKVDGTECVRKSNVIPTKFQCNPNVMSRQIRELFTTHEAERMNVKGERAEMGTPDTAKVDGTRMRL